MLDALKKYGMIVADNGSNWFITGAADTRWNDDDLNQLKTVPGQRVRGRQHRRGPPQVDRRTVRGVPSRRVPNRIRSAPARSRRGSTRGRRASSRRPPASSVVLGGVTIADTTRAYRVLETSHPPNYYFPPDDVARRGARADQGRSFCEWKGRAHYFTVRGGDRGRGTRRRGPTTTPSAAFAPIRGSRRVLRGTHGRVLRRRRASSIAAARRLLRRLDHVDRRRPVQGRPRLPRLVAARPSTNISKLTVVCVREP